MPLLPRRALHAGVNWVAMVALVVGIAPNVPGFLKAAGAFKGPPNFFDAIYVYAWFIGLVLAGGIYFVGMQVFSKTKSR